MRLTNPGSSVTPNTRLAGAPLFFFTDTAPTEIYTLSLHDALPIWGNSLGQLCALALALDTERFRCRLDSLRSVVVVLVVAEQVERINRMATLLAAQRVAGVVNPALVGLRVYDHPWQPRGAVRGRVAVLADATVSVTLQLRLDSGGALERFDGAVACVLDLLLGLPLGLGCRMRRQPRAHGLHLGLEAVEVLPQRQQPFWRLWPVFSG